MPFQQLKLDRSVNQSRSIFDKYIYEPDNGDLSADVQVAGYFSESRFSPDWRGSLIEIKTTDAYLIAQVNELDNLDILYDSSTAGGSGVDTFNGRTGDVVPEKLDYTSFFLDRANNVVVINSESDFPTQDATTITLEDNTVYLLGDSVSTAKQFICGDEYTGTLPMFLVDETFFYAVRITWRCTNAYSFRVTGSGSGSLDERVNVQDCICYGTNGIAQVEDSTSIVVSNTQFRNVTNSSIVDVNAGTGALISFRQVAIDGRSSADIPP